MRLLILSCNTGEGHNSASRAIKEYAELNDIDCDIDDALAYWSPGKSKMISKGHVFVYRRLPKLFGVSYRFEENHPAKEGDESFIYELVTKGCEALYNKLTVVTYDAVICTHPFSSMMMTEIKLRYRMDIKAYFVATDYTCSPGVSETRLDAYFIPHEKLIDEFVSCTVPRSKLVPTGIPIKQCFYKSVSSEEAKKSLSLPVDKKIVLLMCGSMGCGPIKLIAEELPTVLPEDTILIAICGNNRRLYRTLIKNEPHEKLNVVGFTNKISLYMDAASVVLTKPGGLSSTEASVKGKPIVFINAVPGCETRNLDFFLNNGYADYDKTVEGLCTLVTEYLSDEKKSEVLSNSLSAGFHGCAAEKIIEYICKDIDK